MLVFLLFDLVPENRTKILKPLSLFLNIIILEQGWEIQGIVGKIKKGCSGKPLNPFKVKEIKQFGIWKKNHIER